MLEDFAGGGSWSKWRDPVSAERRISLESSRGGWARLRIELPPVNVLGVRDLDLLAANVRKAREHPVLLVSGLARAFSAGVDMADHAPDPEAIDRMLASMRNALQALIESPAITIAAWPA